MVTPPLPLTLVSQRNKVRCQYAFSYLQAGSRIYYYRNKKKQVDLYTSHGAFTFSVSWQPLGTFRIRHGSSSVI